FDELYPARLQMIPEHAAHTVVVSGENLSVGYEGEAHGVRVASKLLKQAAQAILHGQRQLHSGGAAANGQEARCTLALTYPIEITSHRAASPSIGFTGVAYWAAPGVELRAA